METALHLTVNGQELASHASDLAGLIRQLDLENTKLVAEVNGNIIPPESFHSYPIADGDAIELIRFVGGG